METNKESHTSSILHWSVVSAGAIALFWIIWYFVTGSVPVVSEIINATLPFEISRWWDMLLGPIMTLLWFGVGAAEQNKKRNVAFGLCMGIIFGFIGGICFGILGGVIAVTFCIPMSTLLHWMARDKRDRSPLF